jgi:DNA-binding transcriptional LysR family regulator
MQLSDRIGRRIKLQDGVEPTGFGRALLSGGTAVFDELRQTVKEIEFLADPAAGEVRIGANPALAAGFASVVIDRLSRRNPRITFHLVSGYAEALLEQLRERNVDFLIARRFGPIDEERVDFEFLFDDVCVVAAGAQSPWARRRSIGLAELVNEPWVLPPPGSGIISIAMEAFRTGGLEYPRTILVTDSNQARMNLVATGRFLAIFTDSTLRVPTRRFELRVLPVERDPEESHAEPRCADGHRHGSRGREAAGEEKMTKAMSANGPWRSCRAGNSVAF